MASEWKPEPILRLIAGSTPARTIPLPQGKIVLGRYKECQVVLEGDRRISKNHAEIRRDASGVYVQDLKSTNSTFVNGEELKPHVERKLRDGDQILICEHVLVFHSTLVTLSDDDESSKIIGSIDMASGSQLITKVRAEDRLHAILDISRDIGNTLHLRELLEKILGSLFRIFPQADRGFILLKRDGTSEPVIQAIKQRDGSEKPMTVSNSVFSHVMEKGTAILSENLVEKFPDSKSLEGSEIRTMMGVPLLDQERVPIGMIQIDTFQARSHFKQDDLDLLAAVAGPIGLAVENANLHERIVEFTNIQASLQNAREVQLTLLPESRPLIPNYEFWDIYQAAQSVGGDYFDYLPLQGSTEEARRWSINLGDVAGKGMPAALLMSRLASESRRCFLTESDPVRAMEQLNDTLTDFRFPERFITFIATVLDLDSHVLTIVNAGHMGAMIRRASGTVEIVGEDVGGPPLAVFEKTRYRSTQTTLDIGDVVVLYTDGVHEAMNPEDQCFRTDRLKQTVLHAPHGPEQVGQTVIAAVRQHAAGCPQSDDIGIVCFGRVVPMNPQPHSPLDEL